MQHTSTYGVLLEYAQQSSFIEGERSDIAIYDCLLSWYYMHLNSLEQEPLTLDVILKCHYLLQKELRADIAGKLRDCDVWVGSRKCPNPASVPHLLNDWLDKYGDASFLVNSLEGQEDMTFEEKIKKSHVEFEKIHPFEDGNGRVGRHILNYQRLLVGLPLLIIREGEEQMDYYKWFK